MKNILGTFIIAILILFCFSSNINIKAEEIVTTENVETTRELEQMTEETVYYTVTFIDEIRNTNIVKKIKKGECVEEEKVLKEKIPVDEYSYCFFKEWDISNGENEYRFDFSAPIIEDIVLKAKYLYGLYPIEDDNRIYVIKFDTQNGTQIVDQMLKLNELIIEPEEPLKNGYKFKGWYTKAKDGKKWNFKKDRVDYYITLYAHWEYVGTGSNVSPQTGYDVNIAFEVLLLCFAIATISSIKLRYNN